VYKSTTLLAKHFVTRKNGILISYGTQSYVKINRKITSHEKNALEVMKMVASYLEYLLT